MCLMTIVHGCWLGKRMYADAHQATEVCNKAKRYMLCSFLLDRIVCTKELEISLAYSLCIFILDMLTYT